MKRLQAYHVHDGTFRFLVAARNQVEASHLLHASLYQLRNYGGRYERGVAAEAVALSEPGRVWKQDMRVPVAPWLYAEVEANHET